MFSDRSCYNWNHDQLDQLYISCKRNEMNKGGKQKKKQKETREPINQLINQFPSISRVGVDTKQD